LNDHLLYGAALGGVLMQVPRILLSHNPDGAETSRSSARHRVDLIISGHTHGGKSSCRVSGRRTYSRFGQKYARKKKKL